MLRPGPPPIAPPSPSRLRASRCSFPERRLFSVPLRLCGEAVQSFHPMRVAISESNEKYTADPAELLIGSMRTP